jgi:hypothetical protein
MSAEPDLTAEQFSQLQFHCGRPPPAADPRIFIFTRLRKLRYGVRVDLTAQRNLFEFWSLPLHSSSPKIKTVAKMFGTNAETLDRVAPTLN